jgi:hypothetical protein
MSYAAETLKSFTIRRPKHLLMLEDNGYEWNDRLVGFRRDGSQTIFPEVVEGISLEQLKALIANELIGPSSGRPKLPVNSGPRRGTSGSLRPTPLVIRDGYKKPHDGQGASRIFAGTSCNH